VRWPDPYEASLGIVCGIDLTGSIFETAGEPRELLLVEGAGHIDLYDSGAYVPGAVAKPADYFGALKSWSRLTCGRSAAGRALRGTRPAAR
jgi:hypothetical protein